MEIVIHGNDTLLGRIGMVVKRADSIGEVTMRVVLSEAEYAQIRKELGIEAAQFHPQVLPLYGNRTVYYVVSGKDGTEYNPYIERMYAAAQQQQQIPQDILDEMHNTDLPDEDDEEEGEFMDDLDGYPVSTLASLPAPTEVQ